jgi:light-regulated signal transduction histidine kinase (bacteriophytochrome)
VIDDDVCIQPAGFLLELSPDWIVRRASENVHHFLGESHVTLIDEPLGKFVQAQPLHDLRNLFARLSSTTGVARAYRVRLTDDRDRFDIAFQLSGNCVVLEAMPSPGRGVGDTIGSVCGLIEGLDGTHGSALFEGAVRRMRALTGFDRATVSCTIDGTERVAQSSRGQFQAAEDKPCPSELPTIICTSTGDRVPLFPRKPGSATLKCALLRAPSEKQVHALRAEGIESVLNVPIKRSGEVVGWFRCDNRTQRKPSVETHAAAELFAQGFGMQLEIDRLRNA